MHYTYSHRVKVFRRSGTVQVVWNMKIGLHMACSHCLALGTDVLCSKACTQYCTSCCIKILLLWCVSTKSWLFPYGRLSLFVRLNQTCLFDTAPLLQMRWPCGVTCATFSWLCATCTPVASPTWTWSRPTCLWRALAGSSWETSACCLSGAQARARAEDEGKTARSRRQRGRICRRGTPGTWPPNSWGGSTAPPQTSSGEH